MSAQPDVERALLDRAHGELAHAQRLHRAAMAWGVAGCVFLLASVGLATWLVFAAHRFTRDTLLWAIALEFGSLAAGLRAFGCARACKQAFDAAFAPLEASVEALTRLTGAPTRDRSN